MYKKLILLSLAVFAFTVSPVSAEVRDSVREPNPHIDQVVTPVGSVIQTANEIPNAKEKGYLLCDGSAYPKSEYKKLADVIGSIYGPNSSSYFTLPDFRGVFFRGYDDGSLSGKHRAGELGELQHQKFKGTASEISDTHFPVMNISGTPGSGNYNVGYVGKNGYVEGEKVNGSRVSVAETLVGAIGGVGAGPLLITTTPGLWVNMAGMNTFTNLFDLIPGFLSNMKRYDIGANAFYDRLRTPEYYLKIINDKLKERSDSSVPLGLAQWCKLTGIEDIQEHTYTTADWSRLKMKVEQYLDSMGKSTELNEDGTVSDSGTGRGGANSIKPESYSVFVYVKAK